MTLNECREQLSDIDARIAPLIEQRMDVVLHIARIKQDMGLPVRDEAQEAKKLGAVSALVKDEYRPYIEQIFKEMFAASRACQEALRGGDAKR